MEKKTNWLEFKEILELLGDEVKKSEPSQA